MECEVIGSVTGQQLGAATDSSVGSGPKLDTFDDVEDANDTWCESAADRRREIRERRPHPAS